MTEEDHEADLNEILDLIAGKGKFSLWGGAGLHTYPTGDENKKKIFAMCLELEGRNLIYRLIDEPEHVCFKATTTVMP